MAPAQMPTWRLRSISATDHSRQPNMKLSWKIHQIHKKWKPVWRKCLRVCFLGSTNSFRYKYNIYIYIIYYNIILVLVVVSSWQAHIKTECFSWCWFSSQSDSDLFFWWTWIEEAHTIKHIDILIWWWLHPICHIYICHIIIYIYPTYCPYHIIMW